MKLTLDTSTQPSLHARPQQSVFSKGVALCCAVVLCFALGSLVACSTDSSSNSSSSGNSNANSNQDGKEARTETGYMAPDFSFTSLDGQTKKVSDYRGKPVLLNFWATWCGYCIEEMPSMQKITENYPDVAVITINRGDTDDEANAFAQKSSYDFTWGINEDGTAQQLYPASGIPYSVIIDKDGVIVEIYEGSAPDMYPYFEKALKEAGA